MLTLYYSPGACSLAPHIALEEAGANYALQLVSISKGEQLADEYVQNVNPRGKVPAPRTEHGVLTENVAILTYIACLYPHAKLLPEKPIGIARCISQMAWLSNTVHPAFTHIVRPGRFATDEAAPAVGARLAVFGLRPLHARHLRLGRRAPYPGGQLANYTAFKNRMLQRPAVRTVLEREESRMLQG